MSALATTQKREKKYVPSIKALTILCEQNYVCLSKLIPEFSVDREFTFLVNHDVKYDIKVLECFKYTSIVQFTQQVPYSDAAASLIQPPRLQIRLYHDAKLAEVLACQNISKIKPRYDYPNKEMMQPDEKWQVNMFLREWSELCLRQGRVAVDLSQFGG